MDIFSHLLLFEQNCIRIVQDIFFTNIELDIFIDIFKVYVLCYASALNGAGGHYTFSGCPSVRPSVAYTPDNFNNAINRKPVDGFCPYVGQGTEQEVYMHC